jgi:hypothetical protein
MNDIELLQYGLDEGLHKKEGWLWRRLILEDVVEDFKEALRVRVFQAHQAQKIFIMAQKQVVPVGWDPIDPMRSVKVHKVTGRTISKLVEIEYSSRSGQRVNPIFFDVCVWHS